MLVQSPSLGLSYLLHIQRAEAPGAERYRHPGSHCWFQNARFENLVCVAQPIILELFASDTQLVPIYPCPLRVMSEIKHILSFSHSLWLTLVSIVSAPLYLHESNTSLMGNSSDACWKFKGLICVRSFSFSLFSLATDLCLYSGAAASRSLR